MKAKVRARDRYEDGAKWVELVTADESICNHAETICDNCVHMGWSDDWEIQVQEWVVVERKGLIARWVPVDLLSYPDHRESTGS